MHISFLNKTPFKIDIKQRVEPILFETIKIEYGRVCNLEYHQERVDRAFKEFFKSKTALNLKKELNNFPRDNIYRAKLIYNKDGLKELNYYIYNRKTISNIMLIEMTNINYQYKFLNREFFDKLNSYYRADEFLITQNGCLKDTTIANIALYNKQLEQWHTPKTPLLEGTTLNRYLKRGKLIKKDIHYQDLKNYSKIAFLNAMIEWVEYDIKG